MLEELSDKFTKYGYSENGGMNLKYWYLTPARYENHAFIQYNNNNLDDIANALSNYDIEIKVSKSLNVTSDLNSSEPKTNETFDIYTLTGDNRMDFSLFIEPKTSFFSFKTDENLTLKGLQIISENLKVQKLKYLKVMEKKKNEQIHFSQD